MTRRIILAALFLAGLNGCAAPPAKPAGQTDAAAAAGATTEPAGAADDGAAARPDPSAAFSGDPHDPVGTPASPPAVVEAAPGPASPSLSPSPADPAAVPVAPAPTGAADPSRPRWSADAADPPLRLRATANLSIFHFTVPLGAISSSELFWKRVDERAVDVHTYEILFKNGVRVGRAPLADLDHYLKLLEQQDATAEPQIFAAAGPTPVPLPMKRGVRDLVMYDFDPRNVLTVRSYEECDLSLTLSFGPAPRKDGDVRLELVPTMTTTRRRIVPIGDVETREFEVRAADKLFHLNLRADIPLDRFLILAPSPEARAPMSLGHAFLSREAATRKLEDVLIFIPRAVRQRPTRPPGGEPVVDPNQ